MATGATEFIDNTSADVFIPELWSTGAIVQREATLVFGGIVDRRYEKEMKVGDTLHVPSVSNLDAARTKSENSSITYSAITESNTDIVVNTHDYQAIAVESITKLQTNRDQLSQYSGKMGYSLALKFDSALAALVDDLSHSVGTLVTTLDINDIIASLTTLANRNVPMTQRAFIFHPEQSYELSLIHISEPTRPY